MEKIDKYCQKWGDCLVWVFISVYILVFSYLSFLKYQSFNYIDWDLASDAIVLWNSAHGNMLYYPFLEQIIFGAHLYLILFLILPIYTIFQSPLTLLFLQSAFLGLAAFPLYKLAKLKLNKTFALAVGLAYLLYPSVGYINLFEAHFEIYEIFFLFFALYYFEKNNFKWFLAFLVLAMACKENASTVVFMLGVYAFLRKRSARWVLVPVLSGALWFILAVRIVIPHFAKDAQLYQGGFIFTAYYEHLGKTIPDMMMTILTQPMKIARYAFTPEKIQYMVHLFLPTGFLGFLCPAILIITVPVFMQNLLSSGHTHASIYFQYVALLIPFIFYSAIWGFKKLLDDKAARPHQAKLLGGFLVIVLLSASYLEAPQLNLMEYIRANRIDDIAKEKDRLIKAIPKGAPTIATFQFLPKLCDRHELYSMHFVSTGKKMYREVKYEPPRTLEYALIDFNESFLLIGFFPPQAPKNIRTFLEDGNWRVVTAFDDTVLFGKDYQKGHRLCEAVNNPKIDNIMNANISNQIMLLGYNIVYDGETENGILHLVYYWKRIGQEDSPVGFFIQFLDADGKIKLIKGHSLGYRVYSPLSWPKGQVVQEHHYILIPSDVKAGHYNIKFGPFVFNDNKTLAILKEEGKPGF